MNPGNLQAMTGAYVSWSRSFAAFGVVLVCACSKEQVESPRAQEPAASAQPQAEQTTGGAASPVITGAPGAPTATKPVTPSAGTGAQGTAGAAPSAAAAGSGGSIADAGAAPDAGQTRDAGPREQVAVDSDGCPTDLEGFAAVRSEAQAGTTGGSAGETVTVTDQAELTRYAEADEPYVIRVQGALKLAPKGTEIMVASNKTIIGVGDSAEIVEGGFRLDVSVHNVIIRNLTIHGTFEEGDWEGKTQDHDGVQMDTAHHVWIDHCHFHHIGDGIIDSRKDTSFLTVSWNILSDHNKAFGIGWTDNVTAEITIHHNWLRDTNQRNPSTDNVLRAHLYNNWLQRIDSYGNYARGATNMVLENSVFDTVKDPHYFDTGSLVAIDNSYEDSNGKRTSTGTSYGVFDPHAYYAYKLTPTADVTALLTRCAGPRATLGK